MNKTSQRNHIGTYKILCHIRFTCIKNYHNIDIKEITILLIFEKFTYTINISYYLLALEGILLAISYGLHKQHLHEF